jgi:hypothetical protein
LHRSRFHRASFISLYRNAWSSRQLTDLDKQINVGSYNEPLNGKHAWLQKLKSRFDELRYVARELQEFFNDRKTLSEFILNQEGNLAQVKEFKQHDGKTTKIIRIITSS